MTAPVTCSPADLGMSQTAPRRAVRNATALQGDEGMKDQLKTKETAKMNINDLTIGQAKELAALFGNTSRGQFVTPHIGKRCIVRTYASGVFCGTVVAHDGRMIELHDSRRLWSWKAADGISLSAVATVGVDPAKCRFPQPVPAMTVLDALEIIPASDASLATIDATPIAEAR